MDTFLAIASRRDERSYAQRALPEQVVTRILDAGRLAGSARNRQPWRFLVAADRDALAELVYAPANVRSAALAVVVAVTGGGPIEFDAGRAVQNMLLAAWNEGVISCPNGMPEPDRVKKLLALEPEERPVVALSFGYPRRPRDPERRAAADWSARANRRSLDELVRRV